MTQTARFIKELEDWQGDARLYQLSEPIGWGGWHGDEQHYTEFVVVSAVCVMFSGPETYIFPTDEGGEVLDWSELEGSFRGGLDHEKALRDAGYELSD